eukprot:scaffold15849_cov101-Isochrysis_galbana.AAC.4
MRGRKWVLFGALLLIYKSSTRYTRIYTEARAAGTPPCSFRPCGGVGRAGPLNLAPHPQQHVDAVALPVDDVDVPHRDVDARQRPHLAEAHPEHVQQLALWCEHLHPLPAKLGHVQPRAERGHADRVVEEPRRRAGAADDSHKSTGGGEDLEAVVAAVDHVYAALGAALGG